MRKENSGLGSGSRRTGAPAHAIGSSQQSQNLNQPMPTPQKPLTPTPLEGRDSCPSQRSRGQWQVWDTRPHT